jgi:hypothetical protein
LDKWFRYVDAEIGIRKIIGCKNKAQWQRVGIYLFKYEEKLEQTVGSNESEVEINLDE